MFTIVQAKLSVISKVRVPKKHEELGIEVAQYMGHPTCPYCGMVDPGKDAGIRPDENHIKNCLGRKCDPEPKYTGSFKGQMAARTVRVPVRQVIPFPELDEDGRPTGKTRFACSYRWKNCDSYDWLWAGTEWRQRGSEKSTRGDLVDSKPNGDHWVVFDPLSGETVCAGSKAECISYLGEHFEDRDGDYEITLHPVHDGKRHSIAHSWVS